MPNQLIGDDKMSNNALIPPPLATTGTSTQVNNFGTIAPPAPAAPPSAANQLATDVATVRADYSSAHAAVKADVGNLAADAKSAILRLIADSEATIGVALPALKSLFGG
jgi:hypothetical protein